MNHGIYVLINSDILDILKRGLGQQCEIRIQIYESKSFF